MRRRAKLLLWIGGGVVFTFVLSVLVGWLNQHDDFNCMRTDIDIGSGRIRRQHFLLSVLVKEEVCETGLSEAVRRHLGPPGPPVWKRDHTTYFRGPIHTHYMYHGGADACSFVGKAMKDLKLPQSMEREYVKQSLICLRGAEFERMEQLALKATIEKHESAKPDR